MQLYILKETGETKKSPHCFQRVNADVDELLYMLVSGSSQIGCIKSN